jgi:carbon monoxide dehydrogenase subunit G
MEFTQQVVVAVPPQRVWEFLWDIERLAACIPGARDARAIEVHKRYEVVVGERVGPFKVTFPLQIDVLEADAPRRLRASAIGKDAGLSSSLKMMLDLTLTEGAAGGTVMDLHADVTVLGKLAVLGHSMIKRKADDVVTQFAASLRTALAAMAS